MLLIWQTCRGEITTSQTSTERKTDEGIHAYKLGPMEKVVDWYYSHRYWAIELAVDWGNEKDDSTESKSNLNFHSQTNDRKKVEALLVNAARN